MLESILHSPAFLPVSLYLATLLIVAETLNRFQHLTAETTRKIVHIGSGNVILLAWWWQIPAQIGIAAAFVAGMVALVSYFLPILPSVNSVGRQSLGTFFYALSMGSLIALFWRIDQPQYAVVGILVMAWGDGLAGLIGSRFGKHPYEILGNRKSVEGSLTMVGACVVVVLAVLAVDFGLSPQLWAIALIVAVEATALETFSWLGVDNLTVPMASGISAFTLAQWLL